MAKEKIGAAIIGMGGQGNWQRQMLESDENFLLKGSFDIREARQQHARDHGLKAYDSEEQLLADQDISLVVIATPNHLHLPQTIAAIRAGKHVVCEKPAALSSEQLLQMIDAANKADLLFTCYQNRRWDKDYLTAKSIFESGRLGRIFNIESRVHGSRGIPGDWRKVPEYGGGMVLDWGVHLLDQALMMTDMRIVSVQANLSYLTVPDCEDGFRVRLVFENGMRFFVEVSTCVFDALPRWHVQGTNGTARVNDFKAAGQLTVLKDDTRGDAVPVKTASGITKTMAPRTENTVDFLHLPDITSDLGEYYKNIAAVIRGEAEQIVTHEQLLRNMKLMETVFRSAKEGRALDFE